MTLSRIAKGKRFYRALQAIVAIAVAFGVQLVSQRMASAQYLGDQWGYTPGTLLQLRFQNNASAYPSYSQALDNGSLSWTQDGNIPIVFNAVSSGPQVTGNTWWGDSAAYTGTLGLTRIYDLNCGSSTCSSQLVPDSAYKNTCVDPCALGGGWQYYTAADVYMNRYYLDQSTYSNNRHNVATHELGHSLGLAHVQPTSCSAVMYAVSEPTPYNPTQNDEYYIDHLYVNSHHVTYAC